MVQTRAQKAAAKTGRDPEKQHPHTFYQASNDTPDQKQGPSTPSPKPTVSKADVVDPTSFWIREGHWPRQYLEPAVAPFPARTRFVPSPEVPNLSFTTSEDQMSEMDKMSAQYRKVSLYKKLLAGKGSFMNDSTLGVSDVSKKTCYDLISTEQTLPDGTLFEDPLFERIFESVEERNEARIWRDLTPLIVPSAEILAIRGLTGLQCLIESINEGWTYSIPLLGTRPQPDYSVGFRSEAFTNDQLNKLPPPPGEHAADDRSFFMATEDMYFPFLACEVKSGKAPLKAADCQNAHSMTLAVRGVVELFRHVGREDEVHQQVLAFSICHNDRIVRIDGHYPIIDKEKTTYHRHFIREISLRDMGGRERWAAYQFTKNVYTSWMPDHFRRICSAIDQLPAADLEDLASLKTDSVPVLPE